MYINELYQPNHGKYLALFDAAVKKREALPQGAARDKAQEEVHKYYDKMMAVGYFRDSYNVTNLLWKFDLSWWNDISKSGGMSPRTAKRFLKTLSEREGTFERNLASPDLMEGWDENESREVVEKYFRDKYEELKRFLQSAIDGEYRIECSV